MWASAAEAGGPHLLTPLEKQASQLVLYFTSLSSDCWGLMEDLASTLLQLSSVMSLPSEAQKTWNHHYTINTNCRYNHFSLASLHQCPPAVDCFCFLELHSSKRGGQGRTMCMLPVPGSSWPGCTGLGAICSSGGCPCLWQGLELNELYGPFQHTPVRDAMIPLSFIGLIPDYKSDLWQPKNCCTKLQEPFVT